jgi:short-subunit dehydrogenase
MKDIGKKTALVTGANRGLGLALSRQLAAENYDIIALCRQSSSELRDLNSIIIENVDVAQITPTQISELTKYKLDLVIHNAGIGLQDTINTLDFVTIENHFRTNAYAPLALTLALMPCFKKGAKVALISSRLASIKDNNSSGSYAYRASKAALNMIGKNLSIDLKSNNVSVAILSPGMVDTDMLRALGITTGADPNAVAKKLLKLIDNLTLENSGTFWHIDGAVMPW